jgi:hypothetical protein
VFDPAAFASAIGEAVAGGIASAFEARDRAAAAAAPPAAPAAEAAPAAPAVTEAAPAAPPAPAAEAAPAAPAATAPPAVTETEAQRVERLANERATQLVQEAVADGTISVNRKGISGPAVDEHRAAPVAGQEGTSFPEPPGKLHDMSEDDLQDYAGSALDRHTFGHRTDQGHPAVVTSMPGT